MTATQHLVWEWENHESTPRKVTTQDPKLERRCTPKRPGGSRGVVSPVTVKVFSMIMARISTYAYSILFCILWAVVTMVGILLSHHQQSINIINSSLQFVTCSVCVCSLLQFLFFNCCFLRSASLKLSSQRQWKWLHHYWKLMATATMITFNALHSTCSIMSVKAN